MGMTKKTKEGGEGTVEHHNFCSIGLDYP